MRSAPPPAAPQPSTALDKVMVAVGGKSTRGRSLPLTPLPPPLAAAAAAAFLPSQCAKPPDHLAAAMDKLKALVAAKRKAAEEEFGGKKYVRRGEIEELRLAKLREEEAREREAKVGWRHWDCTVFVWLLFVGSLTVCTAPGAGSGCRHKLAIAAAGDNLPGLSAGGRGSCSAAAALPWLQQQPPRASLDSVLVAYILLAGGAAARRRQRRRGGLSPSQPRRRAACTPRLARRCGPPARSALHCSAVAAAQIRLLGSHACSRVLEGCSGRCFCWRGPPLTHPCPRPNTCPAPIPHPCAGGSAAPTPVPQELPREEVIRRLRALGEPVTLFGESDEQRFERMLLAEQNVQVGGWGWAWIGWGAGLVSFGCRQGGQALGCCGPLLCGTFGSEAAHLPAALGRLSNLGHHLSWCSLPPPLRSCLNPQVEDEARGGGEFENLHIKFKREAEQRKKAGAWQSLVVRAGWFWGCTDVHIWGCPERKAQQRKKAGAFEGSE